MVLKVKSCVYLLWRAEVSLFRSMIGVGQILHNVHYWLQNCKNLTKTLDFYAISLETCSLSEGACQCWMRNVLSHKNLLYLTAAVVFIPDSEAQRRSLQCKRPGFLYSYICVYHRPWAPTEPPGQCGAKFRSETIKDEIYNKRHVKSLTFPFKVGGAELHKIYRLLFNKCAA